MLVVLFPLVVLRFGVVGAVADVDGVDVIGGVDIAVAVDGDGVVFCIDDVVVCRGGVVNIMVGVCVVDVCGVAGVVNDNGVVG